MTKMDSGSAGSHSTGSDSRGSAKILESASRGQKQSPPQITKVPKKVENPKQNSSELDDNRKPNDLMFSLPKPSVVNKTVAWNFSDGSTSSVETPRSDHENTEPGQMGFDANVDTIKRSPYKRQVGNEQPESHSTPQSDSLLAWDEKPQKADGEQPLQHPNNISAAFVNNPVPNLLNDFDPLITLNEKNDTTESINDGNFSL